MGSRNSCSLSVLLCPFVLPAGLLLCCQVARSLSLTVSPFSPFAVPVTAMTPQTADVFPHRSEVPGLSGTAGLRYLWRLQGGPTSLVSAPLMTCFLPSFLFIDRVRTPGQRRGGWLGTHCVAPALPRDSCGHSALRGRSGGCTKDQGSKSVKCTP